MSSQYGQEAFVLSILGGLRHGFFLDSGAADGVCVSNTQLLETAYGWRGICVEPNANFFAELEQHRRCVCVNCCLYDHDGIVEFLEADSLGGIVIEYHPSMLRQARSLVAVADDARTPTVPRSARTVRSVLRDCGAPPIIDYWSLDTEGSELAILKSFPFDEYAFRVLTVEHNWLPVRDDIAAFLLPRGYTRIAEMGCDDGYVRSDLLPRPSWRSGAWGRRSA